MPLVTWCCIVLIVSDERFIVVQAGIRAKLYNCSLLWT
jgi:hypothetical protein